MTLDRREHLFRVTYPDGSRIVVRSLPGPALAAKVRAGRPAGEVLTIVDQTAVESGSWRR
jgi:hypothetical protein